MHFTFIFVAMLTSFSTIRSHPTSSLAAEERNEPNLQRARPIQQFFTNILNALRPTTTTELPTSTVGGEDEKPSSFHSDVEFQEIPNFFDYSTFLLNSLASNNSAINFAFMQPNVSGTPAKLRGNFSVISFLIPHDEKPTDGKKKGFFSFLASLRLPWSAAQPTNTDFSQFPPILEYFTQRIQTYFSVYKYTDDSRFNNTIVVFSPQDDEPLISVGSENILNDEEIGLSTTTTDYLMETTSIQQEDTTTEFANETT